MRIALAAIRLSVLCCLCLSVSDCKQSNKGIDERNANCSQFQNELTVAVDSKNSDSSKTIALKALLKKTASACPSVSKMVLSKLFRLAARNPLDKSILQFFEETENDAAIDNKIRVSAFYNSASYYLFLKNNADSGLFYLEQTKKFTKDFDDTLYRSYYALMAQAMVQQSKTTEAGDYYIKAIQLCDKLKDSGYAANLYSNFAALYSNMGYYEKAIEMKLKPLPYYLSKKDGYELMTSYVSIGAGYVQLKKYDSGIFYNNKAIDLVNNGVINLSTTYYLYINQGSTYLELKNYDSARRYFDKGKILLQELNNYLYERQFIISSTPAYAPVKDVSAEIIKIKKYLPELYEEQDFPNVRDAYDCLYRFALSKKQNDSALAYSHLRDSIQSIITGKENKNYIAELEAKYETQKKELHIQVQENEIKRKNTLNGLLIALLVLAALGTAFTITRIQLKRNKKEAAQQQEFTHQLLQHTEDERARIARDLHDSVSQDLLLLKSDVRAGDLSEMPGKIDSLINEIRMIARDLHPVMLDQVGLKHSIEHVCNRLMETNQLFITADISYSKSLGKSHELQLFRIIQEALNNIIKYAGAEAAKVSLTESPQSIQVEIQDNGKGFDVQASLNEKMSFGLLSMIERSKTLGGKAEIKSTSAGTNIKIEIPRIHA